MKIIDLRSDTVTRPAQGMYDAMMSAPVGDDVYGEDETVNALELAAAELLGKEAGLFLSSGTQSNLVSLLTHCGRGDEFIVGDQYHIYLSEAGGASVLGGLACCVLATDDHGGLQPEQVIASIKDDDPHLAISRVLCLENTVHGMVQKTEQIRTLAEAASSRGLAVHFDGARLLNAAVALDEPAANIVAPVDTVSLCLSKGLGAPVGTVLCGPADFIRSARRQRKLLGGGMRQAGILAACGLYALEHHVERLAEDHANARLLADGLSSIESLRVTSETNMVFVVPPVDAHTNLRAHLIGLGIRVGPEKPAIRMVTHLDISRGDIECVIDSVIAYFQK
ncbi:MAG: low-specificity L-threonine aldolase [Proteobacteria bacterium]|nr:low-specificity L-threonine aldolase [Pseudomonadota bacterium]